MRFEKKWAKVVALALSFPSTILATGFVLMKLAEGGALKKSWAVIVFLLVVGNILFLMVNYAYKIKNKS